MGINSNCVIFRGFQFSLFSPPSSQHVPPIPIQQSSPFPCYLPSSPPHHPPNPATNNISIFETGFAVNIPYGTILIWTSMSDSKFSLRGLCTVCVSIKYAQNKFNWRKVKHRRNAAADFSWQSENSLYILLVWFYNGSVLFVMEYQWFIFEMQSKQSTGIPSIISKIFEFSHKRVWYSTIHGTGKSYQLRWFACFHNKILKVIAIWTWKIL